MLFYQIHLAVCVYGYEPAKHLGNVVESLFTIIVMILFQDVQFTLCILGYGPAVTT